ncbi:NAD(P)/FAD-dependent oxidoreductase [Candidatus Margulisiibacteriota bacterium]
MYDLIIIGCGPAGITAAIYAVRKKITTLILTSNIGGQTSWSGEIENYTGFRIISGPELTQEFEEHVKKYGIPIKEHEPITSIQKKDDIFEVTTKKDTYQSKAIIIASGKMSKRLSVPGEMEYQNKGVTYCATCDGPLFADKPVAIIGGGNSALDAAIQLMAICPKVYIVNITNALTGDPVMIEKVQHNDHVEIFNNSTVKEIKGNAFVEEIVVVTSDGEKTLPVKGVFVEIGLIPNSDFGIEVTKNDHNEIIVNNKNETNIPGLFAAGDVTDVPEKQIIVAAGEGAKAALTAVKYLYGRV